MGVPVEFISGGSKVQGAFFPASEDPSHTVLLLQGLPGDDGDVIGIGERMSQHGINAFTFNYRGTYRSEGACSLLNTQGDIQAAYDYLLKGEVFRGYGVNPAKLVLGGLSYGGGMAFSYAATHPEIMRVFMIAGNDHGEFAREYLRNPDFRRMVLPAFEGMSRPEGPVDFGSDSRAILDELTENPDPYDLRLNAESLSDRDILLLCGWDDPYVTIEDYVLPLYRRLKNLNAPVRIVSFQDDHVFNSSREELAHTIIDWIKTGCN